MLICRAFFEKRSKSKEWELSFHIFSLRRNTSSLTTSEEPFYQRNSPSWVLNSIMIVWWCVQPLLYPHNRLCFPSFEFAQWSSAAWGLYGAGDACSRVQIQVTEFDATVHLPLLCTFDLIMMCQRFLDSPFSLTLQKNKKLKNWRFKTFSELLLSAPLQYLKPHLAFSGDKGSSQLHITSGLSWGWNGQTYLDTFLRKWKMVRAVVLLQSESRCSVCALAFGQFCVNILALFVHCRGVQIAAKESKSPAVAHQSDLQHWTIEW